MDADRRGRRRSPSTATACSSASEVVARAPGRRPATLEAAIDEARAQHGRRARALRREHARVHPRRRSTCSSTTPTCPTSASTSRAGTCSSSCAGSTTGRTSRCSSSGYLRECGRSSSASTAAPTPCSRSGVKPDVIIGDMDSVSERALRCGAAAGRARLHRRAGARARSASTSSACPTSSSRRPGTSEDIAMLLAYEKGAELIVAVGTHSSMVEFLDKGRAGHGVDVPRAHEGRRRVLVDAKGVSRLYRSSVRTQRPRVADPGRRLHPRRGARCCPSRSGSSSAPSGARSIS